MDAKKLEPNTSEKAVVRHKLMSAVAAKEKCSTVAVLLSSTGKQGSSIAMSMQPSMHAIITATAPACKLSVGQLIPNFTR